MWLHTHAKYIIYIYTYIYHTYNIYNKHVFIYNKKNGLVLYIWKSDQVASSPNLHVWRREEEKKKKKKVSKHTNLSIDKVPFLSFPLLYPFTFPSQITVFRQFCTFFPPGERSFLMSFWEERAHESSQAGEQSKCRCWIPSPRSTVLGAWNWVSCCSMRREKLWVLASSLL